MIDSATNMKIVLFHVTLEKAMCWLLNKSMHGNRLGGYVGEEDLGGNLDKIQFERKTFYYDGNRKCLLEL